MLLYLLLGAALAEPDFVLTVEPSDRLKLQRPERAVTWPNERGQSAHDLAYGRSWTLWMKLARKQRTGNIWTSGRELSRSILGKIWGDDMLYATMLRWLQAPWPTRLFIYQITAPMP